MIRKATQNDIAAVAAIYEAIHTEEEQGRCTTGWLRGIYPTAATAEASLVKGELFVMEDGGRIVAAARINQEQSEEYALAKWEYPAKDSQVMVLHTLVVLPECSGRGYGRQFVFFYEDHARAQGCEFLRMDTNARNLAARRLYSKLGYREIGIVPCNFNGIPGVQLVCLEKKL